MLKDLMMRTMMLNCKETVSLSEQSKIVKLGFIPKLKVQLHYDNCKICSIYKTQSELLDKALSYNYIIEKLNKRELGSDFIEDLKIKIDTL